MMKFELGLEKPSLYRARNSALTIGGAYIIGGFIPLLGYVFTDLPMNGLLTSSVLTILSLMVFGYFKSKVTGQPPIGGAFKTMLIGVVAAAAAYTVAQLLTGTI